MNHFFSIALTVGLSVLSMPAFSAPYQLDASHGEVGFAVKHLMISTVKGAFDKKEGSFDFDEKKGELSNVVAKIDMASVNTREPKRDDHLRSPDFFDVKKFPTMEFKSTGNVILKKDKKATLKGELTLHGVTKPINLDVVYTGSANDPWGNQRVGFKATGKIKRDEFGVSWNKTLDKGGAVVGNEVEISLDGEGIAQKIAATDPSKK